MHTWMNMYEHGRELENNVWKLDEVGKMEWEGEENWQ